MAACVVAALLPALVAPPLARSPVEFRRRHPNRPQRSEASRLFCSIARGDGGDAPEVTLPAIAVPLALPLWVGELREIRTRSVLRAAQPLLGSLRPSETFAFLTAEPSEALVGSVVTEARLVRATWAEGAMVMERALVVGVARFRVSSASGELPLLLLRGAAIDEPSTLCVASDGSAAGDETAVEEEEKVEAARLAALSAARARAEALWSESVASASTAEGGGGGDGGGGGSGGGNGNGNGVNGEVAAEMDAALAHGVPLTSLLEAAAEAVGLPPKAADSPAMRREQAAQYRALIERTLMRHHLAEPGEMSGEGSGGEASGGEGSGGEASGGEASGGEASGALWPSPLDEVSRPPTPWDPTSIRPHSIGPHTTHGSLSTLWQATISSASPLTPHPCPLTPHPSPLTP
jgi:uncharacterized membrane protein YgcG